MSESFRNSDGGVIVGDLVAVINKNRQYLSDIDGQIGDGDHGINMAKGFNQAAAALEAEWVGVDLVSHAHRSSFGRASLMDLHHFVRRPHSRLSGKT